MNAAAPAPEKKSVSKLSIPHKHILSIENLSAEDINTILDLSE